MNFPVVEKPLDTAADKTRFPFLEHLPIPRSHSMRDLTFCLLLLGTLTYGSWLWLARIAWTVLPLFFLVDFRYSLYAIFFFASFFHPTGFLPDFFFSTKHFHMALMLTAVVQMLHHRFFNTLASGIQRSRAFFPILGIILIGLTDSVVRHGHLFEITAGLNLMSIILAFFYLSGLAASQERAVENAIPFFITGVCVQIAVAFFNWGTRQSLWSLQSIMHNNHLGVLAALTLFHALAFTAAQNQLGRRIFGWTLAWILFLGAFFSCSRTAWFSFLFSLIPFCILFNKLPDPKTKQRFVRDCSWMGLALPFVVLFGIGVNNSIFCRFYEMPRLWDGWFWNYTLHDRQNFGFFGVHRLNQIHETVHVLKHSPIFGFGFVQSIVDFHSLYLTILGIGGVVGFGLFAFFCVQLIKRLYRAIRASTEISSALMRLGAFCAVTAWLTMAFMETLLLQYPIWMHAMLAVFLSQTSPSIKRSDLG